MESSDIARLAQGSHGDPFSVLGRHARNDKEIFRCFLPRSRNAWIEDENRPMSRVEGSDLFEFLAEPGAIPAHYRIIREDDSGYRHINHDPYSFWSMLKPDEMEAFHQGEHRYAQNLLGARRHSEDGIEGVIFAVWAPNAGRVSVVGDFNDWDGRCHPMRRHVAQGIWELFIPGLQQEPYKYEIRNARTSAISLKTDPFASACEYRPDTASLVPQESGHDWLDGDWMKQRTAGDWGSKPMSVYEVHLGSWRRSPDGSFMGYRQLAQELCAYVKNLGFTHIELLPVMEHPLDESWGYQVTGYFAPTSRFGKPDDFRAFVDHFHLNGIGVLLDWVPAHFPRDDHALAAFDGEALYEYHHPLKAEHRDWGTLVFNYERREVCSFLISNAIYWLNEFHLDGLRVDAVASMLYLDFSRQAEQWVPNIHGGNENLEAIDFIKKLNNAVSEECPGCVMMAEESTDWPGVTGPTSEGGLGFGLKWNMGWMHDSLDYFSKDPVYRKYHQGLLTFGPMYVFNENFMSPLSHDEVVHLKKSLLGRMPGDEWQRFANLRLLFTYQWTYPGKQLIFMGSEFAQETEWDSGSSLPWSRSQENYPAGVSALLSDLNHLQAGHPALYQWDCDQRGFEWLNADDVEQSVISFIRNSESESLLVVLNFTPVPRQAYRIAVPEAGTYLEIFNSDDDSYRGSGMGNKDPLQSEATAHRGRKHSLCLTLPPLAGIVLQRQAA
ncbi:MAG: 1,4-alpha-glucan branching protein GlgB [Proteobacteria bacterium]|nr:1,4-alpha-glucan branching protein GlgB [Pseudomonadota bacterium]